MNMFEQMPFSEKYPVFRKLAEIGGSQFRESPIFFFLLILFKYFSQKPWNLQGKVVSLRQIRNNNKVKQYGCSYK